MISFVIKVCYTKNTLILSMLVTTKKYFCYTTTMNLVKIKG